MDLMFADEADHDRGRGQNFFVYGAIFVEADRFRPLHDAIEEVRRETGFRPEDSLKFATNTRPDQLTREEHTEAKSRVLALAAEHRVEFCAYVMLHELARNRDLEDLVQWGANTLLGKFQEYCASKPNGHGVVYFDRMPIAHEHRYYREKFTVGLSFPNGRTSRLDRIMAFGSTCDGASHLSSVADIVLGSFRYCVNEPERDIAGRAMFPAVARLMWKRRIGDRVTVRERGLVVRPQRVTEAGHRAQYDGLRERLAGYLQPAA